jgi:hypothetical protein
MLLAMFSLLFAAARAEASANGKVQEPNELTMQLSDGYLAVVEGSIGDLRGLKFLLDTGATNSAISPKIAERLGLARRPGKLVSFDKTVAVNWTDVAELAYGPEQVYEVRVMVIDLKYLLASGVCVDAVIGWDLLRRRSFTLDFARKRVVFGLSEPRGSRSVPMRTDTLFPEVQVDLDGRSLWMIADTGMRGTLFYEGLIGEIDGSYVGSETRGWTASGALDSRTVFAPRLRLGGQDLERQVSLVRPSDSQLLRGVAGFLGIGVLEAKEVTFDFERNELSWKK